MTLIDLYEKISKLPLTAETAKVMIKHEPVGYEHETMDVEYDEKNKIFWIEVLGSMEDGMPSICPQCGQPMDFFNAFMAHGSRCRYCGYKWEISETTREVKVSNDIIRHFDGKQE